ncbi:MAG: hypothetical protein WAX77_09270 [Methylococcaceae bacterium]
MDNSIYLGIFVAIVIVAGLFLSGKFKLSLSKNKLNVEAKKEKTKNVISATNITNKSEVKIKKGDNHDITVDKIDGESKVDIQ